MPTSRPENTRILGSEMRVIFLTLPDSRKAGHEAKRADEDFSAKRASSKSLQSQSSIEDTSWAAADSSISSRRTGVRVSFKGDKELSEVHDIVS